LTIEKVKLFGWPGLQLPLLMKLLVRIIEDSRRKIASVIRPQQGTRRLG